MNPTALPLIAASTAAEVCRRFALGEEARVLLSAGQPPGAFLDVLIRHGLHTDAARFLAHALPKREAVWWALRCAREVAGAEPPEAVAAALNAAETWVLDPSEPNRRAAMPAAEAAGFGTPAGCAALAVFWSGGSLAPPDLPAVPPADHLTAHGVSCGVMLAAVQNEPQKAPERYQRFFALGLAVAEGQDRWSEPAPAARPRAESTPKPSQPAASPASSSKRPSGWQWE
jgi:hypothetical protein